MSLKIVAAGIGVGVDIFSYQDRFFANAFPEPDLKYRSSRRAIKPAMSYLASIAEELAASSQ